MPYDYNKKLTQNSQRLRKNMTPEEKHIWYDFFKKLPFTVNRQKCIGNYIVDFFVYEKNTVIEIDGCQHKEEKNAEADRIRDDYLISLGITVLRYSNEDINKNFTRICDELLLKFGLRGDEVK